MCKRRKRDTIGEKGELDVQCMGVFEARMTSWLFNIYIDGVGKVAYKDKVTREMIKSWSELM